MQGKASSQLADKAGLNTSEAHLYIFENRNPPDSRTISLHETQINNYGLFKISTKMVVLMCTQEQIFLSLKMKNHLFLILQKIIRFETALGFRLFYCICPEMNF